jgi:hypothetical protein
MKMDMDTSSSLSRFIARREDHRLSDQPSEQGRASAGYGQAAQRKRRALLARRGQPYPTPVQWAKGAPEHAKFKKLLTIS